VAASGEKHLQRKHGGWLSAANESASESIGSVSGNIVAKSGMKSIGWRKAAAKAA